MTRLQVGYMERPGKRRGDKSVYRSSALDEDVPSPDSSQLATDLRLCDPSLRLLSPCPRPGPCARSPTGSAHSCTTFSSSSAAEPVASLESELATLGLLADRKSVV